MFKGILLNKNEDGTTRAELTQIDEANLPADGDVTIAVEYSTINYKDGLAITGKSPVVRKWPMVPGIDGAGEVIASTHASWKVGDQVVLNGWGVGEAHMGCLAERAKLKVTGTPTIFFTDGSRVPGAIDSKTLESRLAAIK